MNKRNTRAFALGILVAVSIIGSFYFSTIKKDAAQEFNIQDAKVLLGDNGYIVLTKDKYQEMEKLNKEKQMQTEAPQQSAPALPKTEESSYTYQLKIESGMVSHDIAAILEKEKIIDDADHFETYIVENGYSKRIQLGSFELNAGMSYKQIAKLITKS